MGSDLPSLLTEQERFEQRMGWNTERRIEEADDRADARQEELEFAAYRLDQEMQELHWVARQYEKVGKLEDRIRKEFDARIEEWDSFWDPTIASGSWFQRNGFEAPTTEEYRDICGDDVREDLVRDDTDFDTYADRVGDEATPDGYLELVDDVLDEKMGYEAVDAFLFLRKIGATLEEGMHEYAPDADHGDEDKWLADIFAEEDGKATDSRYVDGFECRRRVERMHEELYSEAVTGRYGEEAPRENMYDRVFKDAFEAREGGSYDEDIDRRLGKTAAALMEGLASFTGKLDRPFEEYFREKLGANRERMAADEDFGVDAGYGEVAERMVPSYRE